MANKARITVAKPHIINELNKYDIKVFDLDILNEIFEANKDKWRLPLAMDFNKFTEALTLQDFIKHIDFTFPGLPIRRLFFYEDASVYDISAHIFSKGYLSHYSAVTNWGLTEQIPKTIYITLEQSNSPSKSSSDRLMEQQAIDEAFKKPQRQSETFFLYNEYKIVLLRGKHTKNLGIQNLEWKNAGTINITDIERTLIDIVVRPSYAGGVFEVLKAFRLAKEKYNVSVNKLSGYLTRLNFIYPYHQAIGFYLEAAGNYKPSQIELFKNKPKDYDFYLAYEMTEMVYSPDWKLYYPKGMI